jgi:hypothetical protein
VNCQAVQEDLAAALLTGGPLDDATAQHVSACPACAAEQASLRQVLNVMSGAQAVDVGPVPVATANELHLQRILAAAAAERARDRRRSLLRRGLLAAAAAVVLVVGITAGIAILAPDHEITASASAAGLSATADIARSGTGSQLTVSVTGVPPDTDCVLVVQSADGTVERIVEWRAEYEGTAHVVGTAAASPDAITHVMLREADGQVLIDIPVRA